MKENVKEKCDLNAKNTKKKHGLLARYFNENKNDTYKNGWEGYSGRL